jgi:hypothetical protein
MEKRCCLGIREQAFKEQRYPRIFNINMMPQGNYMPL